MHIYTVYCLSSSCPGCIHYVYYVCYAIRHAHYYTQCIVCPHLVLYVYTMRIMCVMLIMHAHIHSVLCLYCLNVVLSCPICVSGNPKPTSTLVPDGNIQLYSNVEWLNGWDINIIMLGSYPLACIILFLIHGGQHVLK